MFEEIAKLAILSRLFQAMVREKIIKKESIYYPQKNKIEVKVSKNQTLLADIMPYSSFERFDLTSNILMINPNGKFEITHPNELLDLYREEWLNENYGEENSFKQFQIEIQYSVSNMILAQMSFEMNKSIFFKENNDNKINSSLDWVQKEKEKDLKFSPLAFYEQCVVKGHPIHPGAKTLMGLNVEELIAYSPEWRKIVPIKIVAINKNYLQLTLLVGENFSDILYKEYPGFKDAVQFEIEKLGVDYHMYDIIPVHPWQLKKTIYSMFSSQIKEKIIIPLETINIPARSLVSFRSFAPEQSVLYKRHHIKTAINVLTTSDVRTISPRSTQSGPLISNILKSVQKSLKEYKEGKFRIQAEVAGICYSEASNKYNKLEKAKLGENLSCILRENPENDLKDNEICLPAAALIEVSPLSEKIILFELIEKYADFKKYFSLKEAASEFFVKYISICIPPLLTLMSKYGISLEAHLQNSTPVFKNGEPVAMLVRDFSDVRIFQERLEKQNLSLTLSHQNSLVFCKNISALHKNIFYSFFQSHIGEMIIAIKKNFEIEERLLWEEVQRVCQKTFFELKKDTLIIEQVEEDEKDLFKNNIQLKALTKMRLKGELSEYYFVDVENPINCFER